MDGRGEWGMGGKGSLLCPVRDVVWFDSGLENRLGSNESVSTSLPLPPTFWSGDDAEGIARTFVKRMERRIR